MSNLTPASSMALLDAPIRKRVSESGVRLMQTAIFTVDPHWKDSVRNLAAPTSAANAIEQSADRAPQVKGLGQRATGVAFALSRSAGAMGTVRNRPTLRNRFRQPNDQSPLRRHSRHQRRSDDDREADN